MQEEGTQRISNGSHLNPAVHKGNSMQESGASHPGPCVPPGEPWDSELYKELSRDKETSNKVSVVGQVRAKML